MRRRYKKKSLRLYIHIHDTSVIASIDCVNACYLGLWKGISLSRRENVVRQRKDAYIILRHFTQRSILHVIDLHKLVTTTNTYVLSAAVALYDGVLV